MELYYDNIGLGIDSRFGIRDIDKLIVVDFLGVLLLRVGYV